MMNEILAGTHPIYAWFDAHPYAALAVFALCALAGMVA